MYHKLSIRSMLIPMTRTVHIPESEFEFSYARSSGPGGQNVNKVNSKAILKWDLERSPSLTVEQRDRLWGKLRVSEAGQVVVMSDRYRDQGRNREDCIEKFHALIEQALHVPKQRKKTRQSYSSRLKAKESKKRHSEKKSRRASRDW
jgi:ribosome-associated protein